jgi:hypothetical protein
VLDPTPYATTRTQHDSDDMYLTFATHVFNSLLSNKAEANNQSGSRVCTLTIPLLMLRYKK